MNEYRKGVLEALAWTLSTARSLKCVKKGGLDSLEHQTASLIDDILENDSRDFRNRAKATLT